ncbi:hypothetical protein [Herbidospora cretacea]|uniref:hypothetical protein n=1 Tax=Herbidospora cretacea TaxID=28444 RepID=UPI0007732803|nr:hypothetical protein [Herbidospora cretacea]
MNSWRDERRYLNANRHALARQADLLYPTLPRVGSTRLLTRRTWALPEPLDLRDVVLRWTDEQPQTTLPPGTDTYAEAMAAHDRPKLFENRPCYRLLDVSWPALTFTSGMYFDAVNVGEAAAHEFAAAALRREAESRGASPSSGHAAFAPELPFRALVTDPTDLRARPAHPAISMLTLRHDSETGETTFVLHWRDPSKVAHGGGLFQVMPVGVFQPATGDDFDLWKCVVREYAEEFLGRSEHYDPSFDYDKWPFYRSLAEVRPLVLGIGVDPLTFATDILAVTVFEATLFDALFGTMTGDNDEGHATVGVPFDEESVRRYVTREPMQAAGAAVLELAWRHLRGVIAVS